MDVGTALVADVAGQLEDQPPDLARYLAAFACVLARVAHADLHIAEAEMAVMRRRVARCAELSDPEAALVVELAARQSQSLTSDEKRAVTRVFRTLATSAQCTEALFCLYAVAAADGRVSEEESTEIEAVADELGVQRARGSGLRLDRRFTERILR
jgi:uncharacterized tellurite resistance protein B-like protein